MRVSCRVDDPGYEAFLNMRRRGDVIVLLDGVEQQSVVAADDGTGEVTRHVLDADGLAQIDPNKPGEVWTETVTGAVRIETR